MVDITITATAVLASNNARIANGRAGATIVQGQMVYLEAASNKYKLADADSATAEAKSTAGMALNAASDGQPLAVCQAGDVTMNAALTAGSRYYLSSTPGGIEPEADLSTGELINLIGLAKSTTVLAINITRPGVTLP